MKIVRINTYLLEKPLKTTMCISRGGFKVRQHTLVEVHTDAGIVGLGEGVGNARLVKAVLDAQLAALLLDQDPMNIEKIRDQVLDSQVYFECQGSAICAASALEMACWDIKGQALGVPVYQLLGGLYHQKLECYASECYWQADPAAMGKTAECMVENGFRTIKAHIGYDQPKAEIHRVAAIREHIGQEIGLMLDLNAGYNRIEALQAAALWQAYDVMWLEEPLPPQWVSELAELRTKMTIPIASGENIFQIYGFKTLLEQRAIDVAMPDIGRVGGILETKHICAMAQAYGVPVSPHNYASGILLAATIQVMASTPNAWMLEMDGSDNAVYQELLLSPLELIEGAIQVPEHPGLGVQLPQIILEAYAIEHQVID